MRGMGKVMVLAIGGRITMKAESTPIIAGIDFSLSSEALLRHAAHAAKRSGALVNRSASA
jgi:hypothetical protein